MPLLSKFAYPSIEYVLATAHYPEQFRQDCRNYPTFFPTPPVQVFHIASGHIPVFLPLPEDMGGVPYSQRRSRVVTYRVKPVGPPEGTGRRRRQRFVLERIAEPKNVPPPSCSNSEPKQVSSEQVQQSTVNSDESSPTGDDQDKNEEKKKTVADPTCSSSQSIPDDV